jgi:hypothetical protein
MTAAPTPSSQNSSRDQRSAATGRRWGAAGVTVLGVVVALAVILTLFGPTNTQQATNVPASTNEVQR